MGEEGEEGEGRKRGIERVGILTFHFVSREAHDGGNYLQVTKLLEETERAILWYPGTGWKSQFNTGVCT